MDEYAYSRLVRSSCFLLFFSALYAQSSIIIKNLSAIVKRLRQQKSCLLLIWELLAQPLCVFPFCPVAPAVKVEPPKAAPPPVAVQVTAPRGNVAVLCFQLKRKGCIFTPLLPSSHRFSCWFSGSSFVHSEICYYLTSSEYRKSYNWSIDLSRTFLHPINNLLFKAILPLKFDISFIP